MRRSSDRRCYVPVPEEGVSQSSRSRRGSAVMSDMSRLLSTVPEPEPEPEPSPLVVILLCFVEEHHDVHQRSSSCSGTSYEYSSSIRVPKSSLVVFVITATTPETHRLRIRVKGHPNARDESQTPSRGTKGGRTHAASPPCTRHYR